MLLYVDVVLLVDLDMRHQSV